jgi:hypothetical protein
MTGAQAMEAIGREGMRAPGRGAQATRREGPRLLERLERLVDPLARGDPQSPLRWRLKSAR